MDVGVGRVGHGLVENDTINTGILLDQVNDLLRYTCLGNALVGTDERLLASKYLYLLANFLVGADPHQGNGGNKESEYLFAYGHGASPFLVHAVVVMITCQSPKSSVRIDQQPTFIRVIVLRGYMDCKAHAI
jgi:hypothetical protein